MERQVADPSIVAVITSGEMYHKLEDVGAKVSSIDSKLDNILDKFIEHEKQLNDHETRMRALERLVWRASGVAAFVGIGASGVVAAFLHH